MVQMRMEGFKKLGDDLERVIEKDDSNSSVTTETEEASKVAPPTCRSQLQHLLHTNKFQIGVVCLVIVDCLLVIAELLIDIRVFQLHEESPIPQVLHYMSIGILSVFLVEIIIKIYAFRLEFFKQKLEVFDAIIVIVSFALDVAFAKMEGIQSGIGLLIMFRLWRVARILNGIVMSVKNQAERRLLKERRAREACEQELTKFREYCAAQEREIEALQGLLRKHGIEFQTTERPVMGSRIDVVAEVNEPADKIALSERNTIGDKVVLTEEIPEPKGGSSA